MSVALVCFFGACVSHDAYVCATDDNCTQSGEQGTCESEKFCSFASSDCESLRRFGTNAGGGLAGVCVPGLPFTECGADGEACCAESSCDIGLGCTADDTCSTCGGMGQPCCADDACGSNGTCTAGVCEQCAVDIALSRRHSCIRKANGEVWCRGSNEMGALGDNTRVTSVAPVQVTAIDGNLVLDDAIEIASGWQFSCLVRANTSVWCWGSNDKGQLGDGTITPKVMGQVSGKPSAVQVIKASDDTPLTDISQLALGDSQSCALSSAGEVWCWGLNANMQLGDNTTDAREKAAKVLVADATPLTGVVDLQAGATHTCALRDDDSLVCWGRNNKGAIGDGTIVDKGLATEVFVGVKDMDLGRFHTCVVDADSRLSCWGDGWRGRIGNGDTGYTNVLSPTPVVESIGGAAFMQVSEVSLGGVSCAIDLDKRAWCWGNNQYGQLGGSAGAPVPTQVADSAGVPLESVERLVTKFSGVCAYLTDGSMQCWGRNAERQLPLSQDTNISYPATAMEECP